MKLAVMKPADGDGVLVADFPAEGPGLGEANVMRLARRPAADDAGLRGDEFAMLLGEPFFGSTEASTPCPIVLPAKPRPRRVAAKTIRLRDITARAVLNKFAAV